MSTSPPRDRYPALTPPRSRPRVWRGQPGFSVGEFLEEWLWGKQSLRPSTHRAYETHVRRYLAPALGSLALTELQPRHIEQMYRRLRSTTAEGSLSTSTLRRIHATLMSALNTAVRRGLIVRNPAATVELPAARRPRMTTWTATEVQEFLTVTQTDRLHPLFLLLAVVGLRRGEVVALRWTDVDLEAGLLRVEQSAVRVAGESVTGPPKSSAGVRTVAIDAETARRLSWHACRQRLEAHRTTGEARNPELVFTQPDGTALDPTYVSRHFDRLIRDHGLRRIRLHDLRHTSASLGLASGESLLEVSRRLGHSSISVTADIYSHISPEVARESAERRARHIYPR
jgi:integrase